jgi:ADP-ribose pyrophosphatase YjhB (NUDIX family)
VHTENTSFTQSVAAVCIREGKVLLARHTYGPGKGRLIIPGGYIEKGESPEDAVKREYLEEAGVLIQPTRLIGVRFNARDWYVVFAADYVSGDARSDGDENDEVIWLPTEEALRREDVPDLTKKLIECALTGAGFGTIPFTSFTTSVLYGAK